ncbi:MAG: hypothetical protein HY258_05160 [Chloroflexi bacterium]|nr:hypothetical protein [Chloroflexota bacterium]
MTNPPQQPNNLGNASLGLGIASAALVFGIGLCALTGLGQRWLGLVGTPLFVCGGASAFLGLLGVILGVAGLFGANRSRATAIVGAVLGFIGMCLFFVLLAAIRRGA